MTAQLTPSEYQAHHGLSVLGGWVPVAIDVLAVLVLVAAIGWRTRRWRLVLLPLCIAAGVGGAFAVRTVVNSEGLASDPAPPALWIWSAIAVFAVATAVVGWRSAHWWRRGVSLLAVPVTLVATLSALNQWVGYYPTIQSAWGAVTAGPLPDQTKAADLPNLRGTVPTTGKLVEVSIPDAASGFTHRDEYVYLPPAWFAGSTPPKLPVLMMIAGEFNTPADWLRSGSIMPVIDAFAHDHDGQAPIFVFVDVGGRFNNDTECVDGPRGNSADHLTKDVRPYVIAHFGASPEPDNWGVAGWSMGGTCAIDLTVMHPDLFSTFEDIAGDHGPTAGTKQQTVDRLYGGDASQWAAFDPGTVMQAHGPYTGVSGWFEDTTKPAGARSNSSQAKSRPQPSSPLGFGGHDDWRDTDEEHAAEDLCGIAAAEHIECSVHTLPSYHTWQFAARAFTDALPWLAKQIHSPA